MEGCGIPDTGHDITAVRFSITDISVTSPSRITRAGTASKVIHIDVWATRRITAKNESKSTAHFKLLLNIWKFKNIL